MSDSVAEVTDDTFEAEVLKADLPVLVDMWAPWCGPCRMVSPVIEQIAEENSGKIRACKVNVDASPETAGKFGINAIPTILMFKDGEEVERLRMIGAQPKDEYQKAVDALISG
ncbi:MAG: thioredoxin [Planctomycetota bacterium]